MAARRRTRKPADDWGGSPELPRLHYEAIGRVACEWTNLMRLVDKSICELFQIDSYTGRIVTQHLPDTVRLQMLEAMSVEYIDHVFGGDPSALSEIRRQLTGIDRLRLRRNEIVHGEYTRDFTRRRTNVQHYTWNARKRLKVTSKHVSVADTLKVVRAIKTARGNLDRYFLEQRSPPKFLEQLRASNRFPNRKGG